MDVGAVLIKLKPNALPHVNDWKEEIQKRKQEAIQTLKAEGVCVESWFYLELDGQDYLLAYMRANNIAQAQEVAKTSDFDIDQVHKKLKDHWERKYTAQLLVDLDNH